MILACLPFAFAARLQAQGVPWVVYADNLSASVCDTVNASNVELVVLDSTGELVVITGPDVLLTDTFVVDGLVFFDGEAAGLLDFAEDGDGFRTLWWLTIAGTAVLVDTLTGEPFDSGFFPIDFFDVPCDACELWDDPFDCGGVIVDSDLDGIVDSFDFCPHTPLGAPIDALGCACFEIDMDGDGVDNCDDVCEGSPIGEVVDAFGCTCNQLIGFLDDDLDGVSDCDDLCLDTPLGAVVNSLGCACFELDSDGDGLDDCDDACPLTGGVVDASGCPPDGDVNVPVTIICGSTGSATMMLTFCGLVGWRMSRGNRLRRRALGSLEIK